MKKAILILFVFTCSFISYSQKTVGVYLAIFRLEEPILNDILKINPSNHVSNRYTKNAAFPQYLLDSLHQNVLNFSSSITKGKAKYLYKITSNQDTIFTSSGGEIEGFPRNSKKNALLSGCDEYLDIRFTLLSRGGQAITMPSGKPSHFKPSLLVNISHFDKSGELIRKYKYNFTEFRWRGNARKTVSVKPVSDRRNTLLHPEDLYILILKGIEMTEEKIGNNE